MSADSPILPIQKQQIHFVILLANARIPSIVDLQFNMLANEMNLGNMYVSTIRLVYNSQSALHGDYRF